MRVLLHRLLDAWATALGAFALVGVLKGVLHGSGDWNWVWLAGPGLPRALVSSWIVALGVGVLLRRPRLVVASRAAATLLAPLALFDAARVLVLAGDPLVEFGLPPESLFTAGLLAAYAGAGPATWPRGARAVALRGGLCAGAAFLALLAHVSVVGKTRHGEPAEAIVVLGARVDADGRPSPALEDRVATACALYAASVAKAGTPVLVLSGGSDPVALATEPEVMARLCRARGIPAERLILDVEGVNTRGTARTVARLVAARGWGAVHVVSHDYHLARLQVALRDVGARTLVLPCRETHPWPTKPLAVLREVVALAAYLIRS